MSSHQHQYVIQTKSQIESESHICSSEEINSITMALDPPYAHFLAQNLNNQGCTSIVNGDFDEAIDHLKQALELTQIGLSNKKMDREPCSCQFCSIESFLETFEDENDNDTGVLFDNGEAAERSRALERLRVITNTGTHIDNTSSTRMNIDDDKDKGNCESNFPRDETTSGEEAFIYRRPLRVSKKCIDQCHYMGTALSFVVLFNIALAYQLKAIEVLPFMRNPENRVAALQQPLKLYELAYQMHLECQESSRSDAKATQETGGTTNNRADHNHVNLRFMMLITNNISQIHKLAGNDTKHMQCLGHLLKALMYMSHDNGSESYNTVLKSSEKDGIFENLSPILMSDIYAAAA